VAVLDPTFLDSSQNGAVKRRRRAIVVAAVLECGLAGLLALWPLISTEALPPTEFVRTTIPAPPPGAPGALARSAIPPSVIHQVTLRELIMRPLEIPKFVPRAVEAPALAAQFPASGFLKGSGFGTGLPGGIGVLELAPSAVPPPRRAEVFSGPVRVGGQVEAAKLIYRPTPMYPPLARMAHLQGVVRRVAIISKDGTVQDLKVLSGQPLLLPEALATVSEWRYLPTLLNGEPVEVETEIDVNFTLGD
jgi:protein TonB